MTRRATIREVARLADVSLGTISNYLNDNKPIAPETRERIESAIAQLGFIPNAGVRVMRGGRSHAIAFLIPDSGNPFLAEVARGIEDVAIGAGHVVVTCNTDGDPEREEHYARALSEMRVVGAVAMAMSASETALRRLETSGAPVVILGGGSHGFGFPGIDVENTHGGYIAMRHLLSLGHRDVVFVGGPGAEPQIEDRFLGALRALDEAGVERSRLRRVNATGNTTAARREAAERIVDEIPDATAAFCANDMIALTLESVLLHRGVAVPGQFAIVGYDDIESAELAPVPLTTIRQPQYDLGRAAAELVLELASGDSAAGRTRSFEPELVVRGSTVPQL
ncbi:LacI family DNA-binding transcriptional regulator [Microterricola viridarii]|uniref:HTH lacI-type domain-containing protein n=1 Tax=Microterricola viridarii TaxID=412690 RepID=A0A0Y0Q9K6_9MICO|nr:LacI family DNA-binding transcriptional regulator [Microterricola viridarii]AMB60206.1 hypothetical protein AWU67_16585 [Microterricola viridarii]